MMVEGETLHINVLGYAWCFTTKPKKKTSLYVPDGTLIVRNVHR